MCNVGDRARLAFNKKVGTITEIISDVAILKYPDGTKTKAPISLLVVENDVISVTPAKYDEAVKALMYKVAEDVGDTDQLDNVLEIVGMVCGQLKARLFEGND